jgi:cyanophycin synthetase
VEYPEEIFRQEGMAYLGSNLVILDEPTETEMMLVKNVLSESKFMFKQRGIISVGTQDKMETYQSVLSESFEEIYHHQIYQMLSELGFKNNP